MKDCKFTDNEVLAMNNCIRKIPDGIRSIASIHPIENPSPVEHDKFISFRIGLALDVAVLIDTISGIIQHGVKGLKTRNNIRQLNSMLFPGSILMRTILRRMVDLSFLWKHPENTFDYRDHQFSGESGEWAYRRLGLDYQKKTEQGLIVVLREILGISYNNDDFKKVSDIYNDNYYGKHAIERYVLLHDSPQRNEDFIKISKGNILQCVFDCYMYIDLIIKGFEKYEQVTFNKTAALDIAKDTLMLQQVLQQYQSQNRTES